MQQPQTPEERRVVDHVASQRDQPAEVAKQAKTQMAILWPVVVVLAIGIVVILIFALR